MSWTERFKQIFHKDKTPETNPSQPTGDDALPGDTEHPTPQEQPLQESEEVKTQKEFQESKESFDELQAEYSGLPQEYQKKLEEWSKQAEVIESDFKELEQEGISTEEEVRNQLAAMQEVIREANELVASYEEKTQLLGLQRNFKDIKGVEFLDEEKMKEAEEKIWKVVQEYFKKGEKLDKATLRNKDFKELREEMGFENEKDFTKFLEEVIEGSRDFTVANLKEQEMAVQPEQAGQKDFWGKLKTFAGRIGTTMATNMGIGMAAGKGAAFVGATVFGMGTGGAGLLGLAGAAAVTAGWRAASRHIHSKAEYQKYGQKIENALLKPDEEKDTVELYRANLRDTLQAAQLERLHQKKEKRQGKGGNMEDIRDQYLAGEIKNRDELRKALQKARGSLAADLANVNVLRAETAIKQKELDKIDAALETLYMTESGLELERNFKKTSEKMKAAPDAQKPTIGDTTWEGIKGGIWGSAGRVAVRLPVLGTVLAGYSGYKIGQAVEKTFLEGSKWYEGRKDKWAGKGAKWACRVGGMAALFAISGSSGVTLEFSKEWYELGLGGVLSEEGKRLSAEFGFLPGVGGEVSKHPEGISPSQQGEDKNLPEGLMPGFREHYKLPGDEAPIPQESTLSHLGFKHTGTEYSFNLAEKAHENPNLGKLEQVFDRVVGAKYLEEFGKDKTLDNIEAAKILNVSANLSKMAETGGEFSPLGDIGRQFHEAASYNPEAHILTIHDQVKFDAVLDKLKEHADALAREDKLGGAEEYINRIKTETWEEIVKAHESGIKVEHFGEPTEHVGAISEHNQTAPAGQGEGSGTTPTITESVEEQQRLARVAHVNEIIGTVKDDLANPDVASQKLANDLCDLGHAYGYTEQQTQQFVDNLAGNDGKLDKEDLMRSGLYDDKESSFNKGLFQYQMGRFVEAQMATGGTSGSPKIETVPAGADATTTHGQSHEIKTTPSQAQETGKEDMDRLHASSEQMREANLAGLLPEGSDREHVREFLRESIGNYQKGQKLGPDEIVKLANDNPEKFKEFLRFRTQDILDNYLKNPSQENLHKLEQGVIETESTQKWGSEGWEQIKNAFGGKYEGTLKALQELARGASKGAGK